MSFAKNWESALKQRANLKNWDLTKFMKLNWQYVDYETDKDALLDHEALVAMEFFCKDIGASIWVFKVDFNYGFDKVLTEGYSQAEALKNIHKDLMLHIKSCISTETLLSKLECWNCYKSLIDCTCKEGKC